MRSKPFAFSFDGLRSRAPELLLLALFSFVLWTQLLGLDLGRHYDERQYIIDPTVRSAVAHGTVLPFFYGYPSLYFEIIVLNLAPHFLHFLATHMADWRGWDSHIIGVMEQDAFLFRLRIIFCFLSLLSLFWIYRLVAVWRKNRWEALLAAALTGLSWEVCTHARWVTTDTVMMQFSMLTVMLIVSAFMLRQRKYLYFAALAGGLSFGTKYPAGLYLPIVLAAAVLWQAAEPEPRRGLLAFLAKLTGIFFATFIVTTPGVLLQPMIFLQGWRHEIAHYGKGGHYNYTVPKGLVHLQLMLGYFTQAVFSKFRVIAVFFATFAAFGALALLRRPSKLAALIFVFPVAYFFYFGFCQVVMCVRNLQAIIPFLAILAAIGVSTAAAVLEGRLKYAGRILVLVVLTALTVNACWLVQAGDSVGRRKFAWYIEDVARYVDARPSTYFLVTRKVRLELQAYDGKVRPNLIENEHEHEAQGAIFYHHEIFRLVDYKCNLPDVYQTWFGPYEVNLNYAPTWEGDDRIVLLTPEDARLAKINFAYSPDLSLPGPQLISPPKKRMLSRWKRADQP